MDYVLSFKKRAPMRGSRYVTKEPLGTEIPRMDAVMSVILPPFGFLCKAKPLLLR